METAIQILLIIVIIILLVWDIILHYQFKKKTTKKCREYYEVNSKLNFIIAIGSFAILLVTYLGFDVKEDILKKSERPINELVNAKSAEINSLLESKNILKAGIYIVNDLKYKEDSIYLFSNLITIDNKHLPDFAYEPKLIINTRTGENLRIKKVTLDYFVLGSPINKSGFIMTEQENPKYPKELTFDIWIADYRTN